MTIIQQIVELQNIDSNLQEISELLGDLPVKVEELKDKEDSLVQSVSNAKERIKELDLELKKDETKMIDFKEKIDKYKDQLFLVTSNKQYDALQNEIDHLKGNLDEVETKSLEFLEEKDNLEKQVTSEEVNLDSLREDLIIRREKLEVLINESSKEKEKLKSSRENHRAIIDVNILTLYDKIYKARNGLSVVNVTGSACGGCGAFVPPQVVSEVRAQNITQTCDSCSRFLYWETI